MKQIVFIITLAVLVIGFGVFLFSKNPEFGSDAMKAKNKFEGKTSRELSLMCEPQEHEVMKIYPHLIINIDGQLQLIPANIGIKSLEVETASREQAMFQSSCLHFLHTRDATGTLHVESPIQADYTLSDFFAVWGKIFNKDQILDSKVDDKHTLKMLVNGQESTQFENLILRDNDQIEIIYTTK